MDFELTSEQEHLRDSVRGALERESPVSSTREVVERGTRPAEPWRIAGELGWSALTIPADAGGLGLGAIELCLLCEEHGRVIAPGPFLPTVSQFVPLVREVGTPEQHARFLASIAEGEGTGAAALANRAGRFDRPDASMSAVREGDGWLLRGSRHWVLGAELADEIVVAAALDSSEGAGDGVGLFVVPRTRVAVESIESLDASRPLSSVLLEDVRVEPERALGTPGSSAAAFRRAIDESTLALAMEMVGCCQALFEITLEYAKHREQFGQPIGAFQAIQHKFADLFIALEKARSIGLFAAMTLDESDPRSSLACSMAKASAGDCQRLLAKESIQIHGGVGFTWEQDVHLFVKRIQSCERLLGTSADHRARIADLLGV